MATVKYKGCGPGEILPHSICLSSSICLKRKCIPLTRALLNSICYSTYHIVCLSLHQWYLSPGTASFKKKVLDHIQKNSELKDRILIFSIIYDKPHSVMRQSYLAPLETGVSMMVWRGRPEKLAFMEGMC